MTEDYAMLWTNAGRAVLCAFPGEPRAVAASDRAVPPAERAATARLFVTELTDWRVSYSRAETLVAFRALLADAGIASPRARWHHPRACVGVVFGPSGMSSTGPP